MKVTINVKCLLKYLEKDKTWRGLATGKRFLRTLSSLRKDLEVLIYLDGMDQKEAEYWLTERSFKYDRFTDKIEGDYIAPNSHSIKSGQEDWLAYEVAGKTQKFFRSGDVVELKSGSLPMTIKNVNNDEKKAFVVWFDFDAQTCSYEFPFASLKNTSKDWDKAREDDNKLLQEHED